MFTLLPSPVQRDEHSRSPRVCEPSIPVEHLKIAALLVVSGALLLTGCSQRTPIGQRSDPLQGQVPSPPAKGHHYVDPRMLVRPLVVKTIPGDEKASEALVFLPTSPWGYYPSYWVSVEAQSITVFVVVVPRLDARSSPLSRIPNGLYYVGIPATNGRHVLLSDGVRTVRAKPRLDLSLEDVPHPWQEHPEDAVDW